MVDNICSFGNTITFDSTGNGTFGSLYVGGSIIDNSGNITTNNIYIDTLASIGNMSVLNSTLGSIYVNGVVTFGSAIVSSNTTLYGNNCTIGTDLIIGNNLVVDNSCSFGNLITFDSVGNGTFGNNMIINNQSTIGSLFVSGPTYLGYNVTNYIDNNGNSTFSNMYMSSQSVGNDIVIGNNIYIGGVSNYISVNGSNQLCYDGTPITGTTTQTIISNFSTVGNNLVYNGYLLDPIDWYSNNEGYGQQGYDDVQITVGSLYCGGILVTQGSTIYSSYNLINISSPTEFWNEVTTGSGLTNSGALYTDSLIVYNSSNFKTVEVSSYIDITASAITQVGSITSSVTINSQVGTIKTVSTTLATQGSAIFTVHNSKVGLSPDTIIMPSITNYQGVGYPSVISSFVTQGSFNLTVINNSITNALNNTITIGYILYNIA